MRNGKYLTMILNHKHNSIGPLNKVDKHKDTRTNTNKSWLTPEVSPASSLLPSVPVPVSSALKHDIILYHSLILLVLLGYVQVHHDGQEGDEGAGGPDQAHQDGNRPVTCYSYQEADGGVTFLWSTACTERGPWCGCTVHGDEAQVEDGGGGAHHVRAEQNR